MHSDSELDAIIITNFVTSNAGSTCRVPDFAWKELDMFGLHVPLLVLVISPIHAT